MRIITGNPWLRYPSNKCIKNEVDLKGKGNGSPNDTSGHNTALL